jgi:hypothetical protein
MSPAAVGPIIAAGVPFFLEGVSRAGEENLAAAISRGCGAPFARIPWRRRRRHLGLGPISRAKETGDGPNIAAAPFGAWSCRRVRARESGRVIKPPIPWVF